MKTIIITKFLSSSAMSRTRDLVISLLQSLVFEFYAGHNVVQLTKNPVIEIY